MSILLSAQCAEKALRSFTSTEITVYEWHLANGLRYSAKRQEMQQVALL